MVIDPYSSKIGLKPPKMDADILLVSHDDEGHNNVESITGEPRIINWPGEYEIKGIAVMAKNIPINGEKTSEAMYFIINTKKFRICFLGDIGKELSDELIDSIGDIDILMIPVGGHQTMDAVQAHRVIEKLEPRAVIPMHYKTKGLTVDLDDIEPFIKEVGAAGKEKLDKLVIKGRSDFAEDQTEFIFLNPRSV